MFPNRGYQICWTRIRKKFWTKAGKKLLIRIRKYETGKTVRRGTELSQSSPAWYKRTRKHRKPERICSGGKNLTGGEAIANYHGTSRKRRNTILNRGFRICWTRIKECKWAAAHKSLLISTSEFETLRTRWGDRECLGEVALVPKERKKTSRAEVRTVGKHWCDWSGCLIECEGGGWVNEEGSLCEKRVTKRKKRRW